MRNLKRALSLALASVMLLGMMVVGTSAASVGDFTDADAISNKEAAAITTAIGIFDGYGDGSFGAENIVTRAEMATIICKMLYGSDINADQFKQNQVFTDVPDWAAGYVNMCASLGIVSGYGDGTFRPDQNVTTVEAATMLVKALGYFKNDKEYGNDWKLAVTSKATTLKIYDGIALNVDDGLTRDDTAVLVFNTLTKAVPVMYNEAFDTYYTDSTAWTRGVEFKYNDTLAYRNFKLIYTEKTADVDKYGRPEIIWGTTNVALSDSDLDDDGNIVYGQGTIAAKDEIISVAKEPDQLYTASTKASVVRSNLSKYTFNLAGANNRGLDAIITIDGKEYNAGGYEVSSFTGSYDKYDVAAKLTANGSEVYVYANDSGVVTRIAIINTYLAEVKNVKTDDNGRYITLDVFEYNAPSGADFNDKVYTEEYAQGDYVLVTVQYDEIEDEYVVGSVDAPETVSGAVTAIADSDANVSNRYLRLDGEKISYSQKFTTEANDRSALEISDYKLYLDQYGYVVGYTLTGDSSSDYLFVMGNGANQAGGNVSVIAVFPDGSSKTITVSKYSTDGGSTYTGSGLTATTFTNQVFKYSVNGDDTYSLIQLDGLTGSVGTSAGDTMTAGKGIENGKSTISSSSQVYAVNNDTKFVVVDTDDKTYTAYVGYNAVPDVDGNGSAKIYTVDHNKDGVKDVVFVTDGTVSNAKVLSFYVADQAKYEKYKEGSTEYYTFTKVMTSEGETSITVDSAMYSTITRTGKGLYFVKSVDDEGRVTALDSSRDTWGSMTVGSSANDDQGTYAQTVLAANSYAITADAGTLVLTTDTGAAASTNWSGANTFVINDETIFFVVDESGKTVRLGDYRDIDRLRDVDGDDSYTAADALKASKVVVPCTVDGEGQIASIVVVFVPVG